MAIVPNPLQTLRPHTMTDPDAHADTDTDTAAQLADTSETEKLVTADGRPVEIGGRGGLDPTRYGDWEKNGRCIDF